MKYTISLFITIILLLGFSFNASAREVAGIDVPETFEYSGKTMQLNGVGIRKKAFIKLYIGSLYLTEKSSDADKIIADDSAMAIRLNIKSSLISPKRMKSATLEGFEKSTGGNIEPIKSQIDAMLATFDAGVSSGDSYTLVNIPGSGVDIVRNTEKVATIPSIEFKKALFGIWLSNDPVQANLKNEMLGK